MRDGATSQRSAAILDGAAAIFALHGAQVSMNEIAEAAGVARATLYRYFPTREVLLRELRRIAAGNLEARLTSARIGDVAPDTGIARTVRAFVEVGDGFVLLAREQHRNPHWCERQLTQPICELFERGQAIGEIRDDFGSGRLLRSLLGLIVSVLTSIPRPTPEDMTTMITGLFLDGARALPRA
jgi:TetR/AcrR family transcriptional regulator, mexCD-oprJ operon repressor